MRKTKLAVRQPYLDREIAEAEAKIPKDAPELDEQLDKLYAIWLELRRLRTQAMKTRDRERDQEFSERMRENKKEQVRTAVSALGFRDVVFEREYNPMKIRIRKRSQYLALAFFDGGRLRTILKAKRATQLRIRYLINGQPISGCESIYWRPI